ncbi:MAG: Ku protein [Hyphomicrobiales bacterium]|nr:Ku protein [Hyphomicrobiales bacterium]
MPTVRPYWKGYIKLALVSCPIALYTASSSSERVAFRQINKKTGNRLRQQLIDDVTREPVEAADKGRGYEYAKNSYLPIEDEEIESIEVESNHMIEIDSFVPRNEIDERYLDSPYYIGPNDPVGQEAFAVIREAMRGKDMVALGRVVLAKRERVIMLQPWEKGLLGTTLRYPYEVRDSKDYFYDIPEVKIAPDMLTLAEHILKSKETKFDPSKFVDRYEQAVIQLLEKKQQGMPAPKAAPFVAPTNVVSLMDALRRSIAEESKAGAPAKTAAAPQPQKGKKRVPGQGELLLPIAGRKGEPKGDAKPAAPAQPETKPAAQPASRRKSG